MKKNINNLAVVALYIIVFPLLLLSTEGLARLKFGALPAGKVSDGDSYSYQYLEIFEPFFSKTKDRGGRMLYRTQRRRAIKSEFIMPKPENTRRIFIVGGSVAQVFGKSGEEFLDKLKTNVPGVNFEVINCGMGGYDSWRESLILNEVVNYSPDLIIIFSGNNEIYGELKFDRVDLWRAELDGFLLSKSRAYKIARDFLRKRIINPGFYPIPERDKNFARNARLMLRKAKSRNIPVAICTLPVNYRDILTYTPLPLHDKVFFNAWLALERKDYLSAIRNFSVYSSEGHSDTHFLFYLGYCYERVKDYLKARECYLKGLRRAIYVCLPERNGLIREISGRENAVLVDLERVFNEMSETGIPGYDLLYDNCHWYTAMNLPVSEEIIGSIFAYNRDRVKDVLAPREKWNHQSSRALKEEIRARIKNSLDKFIVFPFSAALRSMADNPDILERTVYNFQLIIKMSPDYLFLRFKTGELDDDFRGFLNDKEIIRSFPYLDFTRYSAAAFTHIGEAYRRSGLFAQGLELLNAAIARNHQLLQAYLSRALIYHKLGRIDDCRKDMDILRGNPGLSLQSGFYRQALGM